MRKAGEDAFVAFTEGFEGSVPWMYLDVKGLVTTGIGNLIDPLPYAIHLPFQTWDHRDATMAEITIQWNFIKATTWLAKAGYKAVAPLLGQNLLHLAPEAIASLVQKKKEQNEYVLMSRFRDFLTWPVAAQLAIHSMAWACGPHFRFPMMAAYLKASQFENAAKECHMDETGNPGLIPRNIANKKLLREADMVQQYQLDPEVLHYPYGVPTSNSASLAEGGPPGEEETGSGPIIHPLSYTEET